MDGDRLRLPANRNCYRLSRVSWALLKLLVLVLSSLSTLLKMLQAEIHKLPGSFVRCEPVRAVVAPSAVSRRSPASRPSWSSSDRSYTTVRPGLGWTCSPLAVLAARPTVVPPNPSPSGSLTIWCTLQTGYATPSRVSTEMGDVEGSLRNRAVLWLNGKS